MIYTVTYVENSKTYTQNVNERNLKPFIRILERQETITSIDVTHDHLNVVEVGMVGHYGNSEDCGHGCKIVKCETCGAVFESHRSVYGCRKGQ